MVVNIAIIVNSLKQITKTTPALVLTEEGIVDNISPANMGLIKWSEVLSCEVRKYRGYPQLLITLADNSRALIYTNRINEALIKKTISDTGAGIIINCEHLDYNRQLLVETIQKKIGRTLLDEHLVG